MTIITTSSFSPQATEFVRHISQGVILTDGQPLQRLLPCQVT
ncbi:MAG: restriction endonuclease [Xanthobacteraceae bacterium]